jgi:3-vinyl bacteriochlorophyllide hydratase
MMSSFGDFVGVYDCSPWSAATGRRPARQTIAVPAPLYTADQRRLRDESSWTIVQGVLAPLQFLVFLVSAALVVRFVTTGVGYEAATVSILVKTGFLALIMVTGAIWEKVVFGQFLFAPAFFWEDVFSFLVVGLHAAYVAALLTGSLPHAQLMLLALTAYAAYVVNATQFVLKLRAARLSGAMPSGLQAAE